MESLNLEQLNTIPEVEPYVTETFGISNNSHEAIIQCIAMHDSYHYGCARTLLEKVMG